MGKIIHWVGISEVPLMEKTKQNTDSEGALGIELSIQDILSVY